MNKTMNERDIPRRLNYDILINVGLTIIISVFVYYLYVLCDLLSVAESAWVKLFILVTANISITLFLCLLNYL